MIDFDTIVETFKSGLTALRSPAENPLAALFTIASMVLVALILVLVAYLTLLSTEKKSAPTAPTAESARGAKSTARGRILTAVLGLVLLGGLSAAWVYSTTDSVCTRCHFTERAVASHAEGTHSGVACRKCHIGPGLSAAVLVRLRGLDNAVVQLTGAPEDAMPTRVANGACLNCHKDILEGVIVARSIRIRHVDLLEVRHACTDCHNTEGHGKEVARALYPRMGQCLACHDGERASAECAACHSEDVGVAIRRLARPYSQTNVEKDDCRGCHPMDTCIACHELELPHSDQFIEGYHALNGYTRTEICLGCHDLKAFCNGCHQFQVEGNGAAAWKRYHVGQGDFVTWHANAGGEGIGSCRCHDTDRQKFCNYCHGPQPER